MSDLSRHEADRSSRRREPLQSAGRAANSARQSVATQLLEAIVKPGDRVAIEGRLPPAPAPCPPPHPATTRRLSTPAA